VTSIESCGTIGLSPFVVVCDYHNDRSNALLEQVSSLAPYV
jgi:hypothetical protein